jgi:hypothetical protein
MEAAEHEEPLAGLRHPIVCCVDNRRACFVSELVGTTHEEAKCLAVDPVTQPWDILEKECPGSHDLEHSEVAGQSGSSQRVVQGARLVRQIEARLAERWTWGATCEEVDRLSQHRRKMLLVQVLDRGEHELGAVKVRLVGLGAKRIAVRREDHVESCAPEPEIEASASGEETDAPQSHTCLDKVLTTLLTIGAAIGGGTALPI